MIRPYDIQRISDLPIEQVAEALGLHVKRHWSLCPFHSDSRPSLYFRVNKNKYRCFVCEHYGGPIDLAMQVMNLSFHDAVCWLAQAFGIIIEDEHPRRFEHLKPREIRPVVDDERHYTFDVSRLVPLVAHPILTDEAQRFLFEERKLDRRVVKWCGISSTHTHLLTPYFGLDGRLQSVQWRYLGKNPDEPRFRFPKGGQCHIYNLQILRLLKPHEPLYVTEGCSDCWAMLSAGHKAIAIPSATLLKPDDWKILTSLHERLSTTFHMYPDQDAPGERLFLQLRELTPDVVRHQLPEGCKDFAEMWKMSTCQLVNG